MYAGAVALDPQPYVMESPIGMIVVRPPVHDCVHALYM